MNKYFLDTEFWNNKQLNTNCFNEAFKSRAVNVNNLTHTHLHTTNKWQESYLMKM